MALRAVWGRLLLWDLGLVLLSALSFSYLPVAHHYT